MAISPVYSQINTTLFDFPYKNIARLITKKATEKTKIKIAVLNYQSMDDKKSNLGEVISEGLIVELVNSSSLRIVERSQVEKMLRELQFNQTGAIDAAAAKKIGNGLGADALVIGSFTRVSESQLLLFTKLVDTETFQVLGASQELAKKIMMKEDRAITEKPDFETTKAAEKTTVRQTDHSKAEESITVGGMFWRSLVLPGWGQLYAHQGRGWIYTGLWGVGVIAFIGFASNYNRLGVAYYDATDSLQTKYDAYAAAGKPVGYTLIGIGSVYLVAILDSVIFGKNYEKLANTPAGGNTGRITAFVVPEITTGEKGGIYAQIAYTKRF